MEGASMSVLMSSIFNKKKRKKMSMCTQTGKQSNVKT